MAEEKNDISIEKHDPARPADREGEDTPEGLSNTPEDDYDALVRARLIWG
jgi:hypothetical protein